MPKSGTNSAGASFERVTLIGVGLLGASLGLALKRDGAARCVVGLGRPGSPSLVTAVRLGAIDEAADDPVAAVRGSDLVVLCTPVGQFPAMLRAVAGALAPGAIVTDVGSTKEQVMRWAAEILPENVGFAGGHPMAGAEKRGPEHARADLYQNAVCLLCGGARPADAAALERVDALWRALGTRTIRLAPQAHDEWVALVSHLPHAAAGCLVAAATERPETLAAAAGGFFDTTRIASGDVAMWTDIFLTNRAPVVAALDSFLRQMENFRKAVAAGDAAAIRAHLTAAKMARDAAVERRKGR